eukprot:5824811-Prymnesium_polylepis.1
MMIIRQHNRSARHSGLGPGACAHKRTRAADGASASIRVTRDAAACVAGELRTLRFTLHHIRRVIGEANATAFLAAHGQVDDDLLADPLWANWSVTQKLLPTLRAGTMQAYTLSKCLPLVEGHEESTCTTFSWIIRLRTDGWYNFHWNGSSWWPPRNPHTVVYVTHCMGKQQEGSDLHGPLSAPVGVRLGPVRGDLARGSARLLCDVSAQDARHRPDSRLCQRDTLHKCTTGMRTLQRTRVAQRAVESVASLCLAGYARSGREAQLGPREESARPPVGSPKADVVHAVSSIDGPRIGLVEEREAWHGDSGLVSCVGIPAWRGVGGVAARWLPGAIRGRVRARA